MAGLVLFVIIIANAAVTGWLVARVRSLGEDLNDLEMRAGVRSADGSGFFDAESPVVEVDEVAN